MNSFAVGDLVTIPRSNGSKTFGRIAFIGDKVTVRWLAEDGNPWQKDFTLNEFIKIMRPNRIKRYFVFLTFFVILVIFVSGVRFNYMQSLRVSRTSNYIFISIFK
jgi:hypothetical protein